MEIINNRYKLEECLEVDSFSSKFAAIDLLQKNKKILLYVIKDNQASKSFINYCSHDFFETSALNHRSLVALLSFGVIDTIDDKHIKETLHYYTTEYFQPSIVDMMKYSLTREDILQVYKQIASLLDFLHFHGLIYKYIELDNLSIICTDEGLQVKLLDLVTIKKLEMSKQYNLTKQINCKSPELLYNRNLGPYTDIYSIGALIYYLYTGEEFHSHKLQEKIIGIKSSNLLTWDLAFYNIIKYATKSDYGERYQTIHQMNKAMAQLFNLPEPIESKSQIEILNFKIPIVGREMEMKKIMALLDHWDKSIIFIHGDKGIGKTRLINEVKYQMRWNKAHVYTVTLSQEKSDFYRVVPVLLRKVLRDTSSNIINKYGEELVKILPEVGLNRKITPSRELMEGRELLRLYDRVANFIIETVGDRQTFLTLDDFHLADQTVVDFIDYFLKINKMKKAPIVILLGYTNDKLYWEGASEHLNTWRRDFNCLDIKLTRLTVEETAKMIKHILGWYKEPLNFATKLMKEAEGNPSYIEEAFKELYAQGQIYVDYSSHGEYYSWHSDFDGLTSITLPVNIDDSIFTLLNTFDQFTRRLLEIISLFNNSVSLEIISKLLGVEKDYTPYLSRLTQLKILNEKLEDWGFTYGFYRSQLKAYIYDSIDQKERIRLHFQVSNILEELYKREARENKEELIFHLFQSNQRDKAIDYCMEAGDGMYNLRIYSQAMELYRRVFDLLRDNPDERYVKLLIRMGGVYQNQGNNNAALKCYREVIQISLREGIKPYTIDAQCHMAQIYLSRNELALAEVTLKECIEYGKNLKYGKGFLEAADILTRVYFNAKDLDKMEHIIEEYLPIAQELNRFDYIGMFTNQKGLVELLKGNALQAKEYFEISVSFLEKGKRIEETGRPINNIGIILHEYYQKTKEAREYFEKSLKISQQYHRMDGVFRAYNNIADCYIIECEYDRAIGVLQKNINLSIEYEDTSMKLMGYSNLVECYINIGEYKQAYHYLLKTLNELDEIGFSGLYSDSHYSVLISFYMTIGAFKDALELADMLKKSDSTDPLILLRLRMTEFLAKSYLGEALVDGEMMEILDEYRRRANVRDYRKALIEAIGYFYYVGKMDMAEELLKRDSSLIGSFNNHILTIKRGFYEGLAIKNHKERIKIFEALIGKLHPRNDKEIQWKIYSNLGYAYFVEGDFYRATSYYLNALEVIQLLLNGTPDQYKKSYLLSEDKYGLKHQLLKMERLIQQGLIDEMDFSSNKKLMPMEDIDLQDFFDISRFQELFQNPAFYDLALQQYKSLVSIDVDNLEDLLQNLTNDIYYNLDMLLKLAGKYVLATTGALLGVNEDGFEVISSIGSKLNVEKINHLLEKTASNRNGLLIMNQFNQATDGNREYGHKVTKATICLPIIQNGKRRVEVNNDKRKWQFKEQSKITGYLYLETDKVFNNFSYEAFNECKRLVPLAYMMLNNYYLKIASSIDKMTGAYVRKYFEKLLDENLEIADTMKQHLSIIMCDIDYFKGVNDTYGHQRGDKILEEVGTVISNNIRSNDFVGRYGGEEFIILLPGSDKKHAFSIAEKIRVSFKNAGLLGEEVDLTLSCGVAAFPEDGDTKELLIQKADQALYNAKERGRNQTVIWQDGMGFVDKRMDKLAGIVTGNIVQDQRNVLVLAEAIEILTENRYYEDKIYLLLGRLIEILEAEEGILFLIDEEQIKKQYCRKRFVDEWIPQVYYNAKLIEKVIYSLQGDYLIDWEDISQIDVITGTPNWKSVIVVPIVYDGDLRGVIYLSATVKEREFDFNAYNLAKITSSVMGPFVEKAISEL
ncbi:diguanylate cyclase [Alkaliphilus hydrothermalis]|uniref:Diguanylate cyclase (GGDEF)-like protein n=1 Tax=Alkaliphilus hydrothermalis TaxID=1482730 RepID=A0ABS2NPK0_9FIRM|nr:diguanylate cyclase [Alkaliphilus hydrothermalis]MBM7614846.1 diguanylate cyclase (GGDEF)-like protein [Alkaliphilus hydrothermalis]